MAVPKKRKSKAKTRQRRTINNRLSVRNTQTCPTCGAPKLPHRACMDCGYYKDEQVVEIWEKI